MQALQYTGKLKIKFSNILRFLGTYYGAALMYKHPIVNGALLTVQRKLEVI